MLAIQIPTVKLNVKIETRLIAHLNVNVFFLFWSFLIPGFRGGLRIRESRRPIEPQEESLGKVIRRFEDFLGLPRSVAR